MPINDIKNNITDDKDETILRFTRKIKNSELLKAFAARTEVYIIKTMDGNKMLFFFGEGVSFRTICATSGIS